MSEYYAHTLDGKEQEHWQLLEDHLRAVAEKAGGFAAGFGAEEWAHAAGMLHDAGKATEKFQEYLARSHRGEPVKRGSIDHSSFGAQWAAGKNPMVGKLLAYALAGHHGGLPDGISSQGSSLKDRLEKKVGLPEDVLSSKVTLPENLPFSLSTEHPGFSLAFFTRMLFSCLVDADYLDTERFMDPDRASFRDGYPNVKELRAKLQRRIKAFAEREHESPINTLRMGVLKDCLAKAAHSPGLFSLTVPTGGGKTVSSLAFALEHAVTHSLERVIYVIPYTSIIEQNAKVFRDILGEEAVLEHHSNYEPNKKNEDDLEQSDDPAVRRAKLATENWDMPVVVTTNVQFFESLFAAKPSRCRKLHNIARSVVILDEAQMLPPNLLLPCLAALRELTEHYSTSVVLCTATQPALNKRDGFPQGLPEAEEVVGDRGALYAGLRRTEVSNLGTLSDEDLAERLKGHEQVLCIVNTRSHARGLYEMLQGEEGVFHLSANMYPVHRSRKLEEIKERLGEGLPCRVVSTQLIEAGVDIDLPVVYRAAAGVDSIAQAAGRCNREGKLVGLGQVYVFMPERGLPKKGLFTTTAARGEEVMRNHDDIFSPEAVHHYFRLLFWQLGAGLDEKQILAKLEEGAAEGNFPFREAASLFKLIENEQVPILIPIEDEAKELAEQLSTSETPAKLLRQAGRYCVSVYRPEFAKLMAAGVIEVAGDVQPVLLNTDVYDEERGLMTEEPTFMQSEHTIQ